MNTQEKDFTLISRLLSMPILLLIFSIFAFEASANQICNSIPECQRVSNTGAVFTRDVSVPFLEEAYRDPSGVVWGSIVEVQGTWKMTHFNAAEYCRDGGARLPTKGEFEQLAKYLGKDTAQGYSPYLADGKTDFLPGLSRYLFWSSSLMPDKPTYAYAFYGGSGGSVYYFYRHDSLVFRCVVSR